MAAILALETGAVLEGISVGATGITSGELVFNTSMTGYQEVLSDPSYAGQLITFTYPHIGNTGINSEDFQHQNIHAAGVIMWKLSSYPSNWRSRQSLKQYLQEQQTVAISNIDTRCLTKLIRQYGTIYACIMAGETNREQAITAARKQRLAKYSAIEIGTKEKYTLHPAGAMHIVVLDFGVKHGILESLQGLNCKITIVPAHTSVTEIIELHPDGILLSNGPGDPHDCQPIINNIQLLLSYKIPMFGLCLGHQLLSLALGAQTYKMPFGHHGVNHPVQELLSKKVMITSQNHNYAVKEQSFNDDIMVTHRSLFDHTIQGFRHKFLPVFGFQGHPEAAPGPHDAQLLFKDFIETIEHAKAS